ncbi:MULTISPECIES: carbohydrate ABC transporter permease [Streptomyces]|uniref:carbohydrate ABC transporter permease n=1 Tax=Streptomyces TaxID=1883 RepID=UPI00103C6DA4|nr:MULTISPECIES: carbohydrate ABC transporter permease [Streptomyces]MBT3072873.1 carbohydrate ABC transporter permease [Streptomyces sp. COG21]MBT3081284.1 carbohydrate ABC transporter permease [Streptomyces sp. COG20]MBT3088217.1 carbohydrate ABC transporter permease [Streptomyces sp. CYG21]MBT3102869.1 carbohydrate ABC transporter permease [Streptomyces sp. COG19]MBT3112892.1 carbohydrate ABC transporter permease [Streptomyces sp. CYG20]
MNDTAFSRALLALRGQKLVTHAALILFGLAMLYPLLWMVSSSLKPEEVIFRDQGLIPTSLTFENFAEGWTAMRHSFGHYFLNSAFITAGAVAGNLVACSLAAYAFARLEFPFKRLFFALMLGSIMLPLHVLIVPQYILFSEIGWINTFLPLIVPKFLATDAFFVFLMVQFIRTLPRELDEAALIDGAGHWRIFSRIIIPLSMPALATTAIFTFIWTWNDFLSQLIFLTDPDMHTVPIALRQFLDSSGESSWGPMFAMSVLALGPIFGFFLAGQKYLVRGIATSGLK